MEVFGKIQKIWGLQLHLGTPPHVHPRPPPLVSNKRTPLVGLLDTPWLSRTIMQLQANPQLPVDCTAVAPVANDFQHGAVSSFVFIYIFNSKCGLLTYKKDSRFITTTNTTTPTHSSAIYNQHQGTQHAFLNRLQPIPRHPLIPQPQPVHAVSNSCQLRPVVCPISIPYPTGKGHATGRFYEWT